ncbi:MAG TPA: GFA family protein [Burkholderiaceae bacterium]|nr:GFA family protein [Burkholderiaceae bacterium]
MAASFSGRCLCGAVRYATDVDPVYSGNCHCRDCQRSSGSAFTPAMMFPEAAVTVTGAARYYRTNADSGRWIERGFCPTCGSQLFARLEAMPGVLGIRAGTLDDGSRFEPKLNFFVASAQPWDAMDPALPKAPGQPMAPATPKSP